MLNENEADIKNVVISGYINGIHRTQNLQLINSGFHSDFKMLVLRDNELDSVALDEWMDRIRVMKADNPALWASETTYEFLQIDCSGHAACVKINVFKGDIHFSTDYMLLYRFKEGWKIVSKIFSIPH